MAIGLHANRTQWLGMSRVTSLASSTFLASAETIFPLQDHILAMHYAHVPLTSSWNSIYLLRDVMG